LKNLGVDTIDLIQLHCPPTDLYYKPEVFDVLDGFVDQGKIRHYGVSVEKVEEGLKAIEYSGVVSVMIIYLIFLGSDQWNCFLENVEKETSQSSLESHWLAVS